VSETADQAGAEGGATAPVGLAPEQRQQCVKQLRLIWAAMALGVIVMAAVLLSVMRRAGGGVPATPPWLGWAPMGLLLVGLPGAYFARNQSYKRAWRGHRVDPSGYVTGNLAVFAMLEVVVLAGLIVGAMVPTAGPARAAAAAGFVLMLLNFPNGRPLDPQPPGLGARSERSADGGR